MSAEWITWGSNVQSHESKEDAFYHRYFTENHSDGPGYVDLIEGPDGVVDDEEYDAYEDAVDAEERVERDQRKEEHPLVGAVQVKHPHRDAQNGGWVTAAWIYGGHLPGQRFVAYKDEELAKWTARLGADRVRYRENNGHTLWWAD